MLKLIHRTSTLAPAGEQCCGSISKPWRVRESLDYEQCRRGHSLQYSQILDNDARSPNFLACSQGLDLEHMSGICLALRRLRLLALLGQHGCFGSMLDLVTHVTPCHARSLCPALPWPMLLTHQRISQARQPAPIHKINCFKGAHA